MTKTTLRTLRTASLVAGMVCLVLAVAFLLHFVTRNGSVPESARGSAEVRHKVLFLSSYNPLSFSYDAQVRGLEKGLYTAGIEYDTVFMDAKSFSTEEDKQPFHDFLKARLSGKADYEAVLLGDDDALLFALSYQDELFAGLPMVFFGVNDFALASRAAENLHITGFYENNFLQQTIELARTLFPSARTFVGLHDQSAEGSADGALFNACAPLYPECAFVDLDSSALSEDALVSALDALGDGTLLFYMTSDGDNAGNTHSMLSRTNTVVAHAHVPIFRNYAGIEGTGILGGVFLDFESQCQMAADTVARVLNGADISGIPLGTATPSRCAFDYAALKRFGVNISALPAGTEFFNRPETFLSRYGQILPVAALLSLGILMFALSAHLSSAIARGVNEELREINDELSASRDQIKESKEQLQYQTEYDEVLGILNRRTIIERMRTTLTAEDVYSVVMLDIDGFKNLNENYGHHVADSILQYLVAIFMNLGTEENWLIGRYGGDEFVMMIPNAHLSPTHETIKKILDGIRAPIPLGDETIGITASLGIANSDGVTDPEQHITNAETAMYEAKNRGQNAAFLYGDEMKERMHEEMRIKAKVQEAFDNDGFYMLYQPQINSRTKKVSGYEALVRMKEPGIYPGQFIPIAERNGWIWRIGRITTELVIKQLAAWKDAGRELHPVSVNYSSNQLNDHGYIDFVAGLLEQYDVPAHYLEIEITEGLFLEKSALADNIFKRFKEMGIRLLMDDFGTGYSSLGYLTYIPVDVIKLDKSLVDTYLVDGKDSFIRNIIHLMHDLDKEMIIEGVEEAWQYERLREFGADTIQGYYFSKPIPADEAIVFEVKK